MSIVISGTGVYIPPNIITNSELVNSYNSYVDCYNTEYSQEIKQGALQPLLFSSESFILKASQIETRHVIDKEGILDVNKMRPEFERYNKNGVSIQAQIGVSAALKAMKAANKSPSDIDLVIASCSAFQRFYPSISIEIQNELGIDGFAFDMSVACSSVVFALYNAYNAIKSKEAKSVLIVSPELITAQINFRDRNQHFLFGDAATAFIVEDSDTCIYSSPYEILGIKLSTLFSKNIISEFGILNLHDYKPDFFEQQGKKVFKEVVTQSSQMIADHLKSLTTEIPKCFWLHQANGNINDFIVRKILNRDPTAEEMPLPIKYYGNTSSCGAMIAYDGSHKDFKRGDFGILAAFGAGYSFGSTVLKKL